MCGIAGRFHPDCLPADPMWRDRADTLLRHRGPDGHGQYIDNRCELIHRRLALVDLSPTGDQPMPNEDGSIYVIFNGEIYNYRRLKSELESSGHIFRGTSDTEVLVHLYEQYGPQMVNHLRGMFTFAIFDRVRQRLVLARDRFGIKPLFYMLDGQQCVFASEIKAILAVADFHPTLDRQACYDYLGLGYIPEPLTGFAEIHALPKGCVLVVDRDGQRLTQYYQPRVQQNLELRLPEAVDAVSEALLRSVKQQSIADVQVAALLSGGIDSSLVVAAYSRSTSELPITFNVSFPDAHYDETSVAQAVSRQYRTDHHTLTLDDYSMRPEAVLDLLRHFDQPFADTSLIPMYWISKAIRDQGIKCTLSGDGGDEVFGGYPCFWWANAFAHLMKLPHWLQHSLAHTGASLTRYTHDWGRRIAKAIEMTQAGQQDSAVLLAGLANYLSEQQKQELVLPAACEPLQTVYRHFDGYRPRGVSDLEELSRRMTENLFSVGLPADMLRKVDMMSMLASIEVRVPMLDEDVVTLGLGLTHQLKANGRQGKLVLRALAQRWLPAAVSNHPKHGFSIPLDTMINQRFHDMIEDLLLAPEARTRAFLNSELIALWLKLFKQARQGERVGSISRDGLYQRIFFVLALELWMRDHHFVW